MTNKIHREVDVQENMKVVVSLRNRQFTNVNDIKSAIAALDYAGKEHLRLRGSITGTGVILGNVMILDVNIPLHTTNSHNVTLHYGDFNRAITNYLMNGKRHVTSGKTLGGFGALNVGYVSSNPSRARVVNVRVETELDNSGITEAVESLGGTLLNISEENYGYRGW